MERRPETPVAVFSARDDVDEAASKAGADAAILKDTPLPDIISSLRQLAE
jgi:DNA-binding NarL/FixJ family response regulator